MLALPLSDIPERFHPQLERFIDALQESADQAVVTELSAIFQQQQNTARQLARTVVLSDFCADLIMREPAILLEQIHSGAFEKRLAAEDYQESLRALRKLDSKEESGTLARAIRRFRNSEMLRLIWRDQNRLCSMRDTTREVSLLAETCIQQALDFHYQELCAEWGTPLDQEGQAVGLCVLGMGKLGAYELNLSSDIDLIFAYSTGGELSNDGKTLSHQEFFLNLGRRLIKALDERTADGFAFRVDMRLRPYGESGALVHSFAALEEYYQNQGRDWERYAMIKARMVAGNPADGYDLMQMLEPFTYRRYIDFSVFESLRSMKSMIVSEVKRRGLHNNVKLGAGGIREAEFIVQVFQLVHGGRDKNLQQRGLLDLLDVLAEREMLPQQALAELAEAYEFLRNTEHSLQAQRDQQTQSLPRDDYDQLRIAWAMGFAGWEEFLQTLERYKSNVRAHFNELIASEEPDSGPTRIELSPLWDDLEPAAQSEPGSRAIDQQLRDFKFSDKVLNLQAIARERLDKVMPILLAYLEDDDSKAVITLERALQIIEAIVRRSAYLVLLHENPLALKHLLHLCANSAYIARKLVQHPLLLDELIDAQSLYQAPDRDEVFSTLRQHMMRIVPSDTEAQMEQLRYFKRSSSLRVAAAEISGALPLMKVSDNLSYIAEALLGYVLDLAWNDLVDKYGVLPGTDNEHKKFLIVAYGKLGGLELSHGSDLDLVFIYEAEPNAMTDGDASIDCVTFYTRLGQRIIHLLSTRTALGQVYDIDMRLRPSGNSGLLVSSCKGFLEYQNNKAWTWEHQALVRARPVAGDTRLYNWFSNTRLQILGRPRELPGLKADVRDMRAKMRSHLIKQLLPGQFDLKHSSGGIVDIEFVVQYAVLAHCCAEPAVAEFTDNIRILDALQAAGLMPEVQAEALRSAYIGYRASVHQSSLQDQEAVVLERDFEAQIDAVRKTWQEMLEE